jgi:hypothetical protein
VGFDTSIKHPPTMASSLPELQQPLSASRLYVVICGFGNYSCSQRYSMWPITGVRGDGDVKCPGFRTLYIFIQDSTSVANWPILRIKHFIWGISSTAVYPSAAC